MHIPDIVSRLMRASAPTLLSALVLPPPFNLIAAAIASTALAKIINKSGAEDDPSEAAGESAAPVKMSPNEIVEIVDDHQSDPALLPVLREAEVALKKYEMENEFRFAELALEDRRRAGDFQIRSDLSKDIFNAGVTFVILAMVSIAVLVAVLMLVLTGQIKIEDTPFATAAFGLIGTAFGFINGIASAVVTFYWGSSQGSKDKAHTIEKSIQQIGETLAETSRGATAAAKQQPPAPAPPPTSAPTGGGGEAGPPGGPPDGAAEADVAPPVQPASHALTNEVAADLIAPHRKFTGSVEWRLTAGGVSVEGAAAERTAGKPATIAKIWNDYGDVCAFWAKRFGVPVELIVATIATESRGDPDAERAEPHLNTKSVGLMQTLITTAREALNRNDISGRDLRDPSLSVEAGTAYIASQRSSTHYDPPLVAAAYNAGSLRREDADANRWKLRCYPKNTGRHINNFVSWFGDAMHLSGEQDWGSSGTVPSFAAAFRSAAAGGTIVAAQATEAGLAELNRLGADRLPLTAFAERAALVKEVQSLLAAYGYLDPPADGQFGPISRWAFDAFRARNAVAIDEHFTSAAFAALSADSAGLPAPPRTGDWLDRVVDYMNANGHWICRYPGCRNIVYLEGVNPDGTLNDDRENFFNDLRLVFWIDDGGAMQRKAWEATTEPGRFYTLNPVNDKGAARIKFGQYAAWRVGKHRNDHEALVQVADVSVHRDLNKDFKRTNDKVDTGLFGINQHWGYDAPTDDIKKASAGCLVGRTRNGHREFMNAVKEDPRFQVSNGYRFISTILPGDKVFA